MCVALPVQCCMAPASFVALDAMECPHFNMRERRCASLVFAAFCRCVHLARIRVSWRMPMLTRRSVCGSKSFAFVLLPLVLDF